VSAASILGELKVDVQLAHLRVQGINFAVFDADARSGLDSDRAKLLQQLTVAARGAGLKIDKSALAYSRAGRREYYGTKDLVRYLANNGVSHWNHTITT
jgi:hypothetical protein